MTICRPLEWNPLSKDKSMAQSTTAYIGLGSNIDDRGVYIKNALEQLSEIEQTGQIRISKIVETRPLAGMEQPPYLNTVAQVNTVLDAGQLFQQLVRIENLLGRRRSGKWSPRTIDLDLLLFGNNVINTPVLTVPHRQMHLRSFVLNSLCELDSNLVHPALNRPIKELAQRLNGKNFVLRADVPQLICVAGIIGVGKTTLAGELSRALRCRLVPEAYDTNPFMPEVYAGKKELALDSQLHFLTSRTEQLNKRVLSPGQVVISDYIFEKENIYAARLLNAEQQDLYQRISRHLSGNVATPVLVMYLRDSTEKCLERIQRRNRPYEQKIELQFLKNLDSDYEKLFTDWSICPVIREKPCTLDRLAQGVEDLANQAKSYVAV
jgi:deoxyguanosine kinase